MSSQTAVTSEIGYRPHDRNHFLRRNVGRQVKREIGIVLCVIPTEVEVFTEDIFCTDSLYVDCEGQQFMLVNQVEVIKYRGVKLCKNTCVSARDGSVRLLWIVGSGQGLIDYARVDYHYESDPGHHCVTMCSFNTYEIPPDFVLAWFSELNTCMPIFRIYYRTRISMYYMGRTVFKCCSKPLEQVNVSDRLMDLLLNSRRVANPGSEMVQRQFRRVLDKEIGVNFTPDTINATSLVVAILESGNVFYGRSNEVLIGEELDQALLTGAAAAGTNVQVPKQSFIASTEYDLVIPQSDNGNLIAAGGHNISWEDGELRFTNPVHAPIQIKIVCRHLASAITKYSVKSTANMAAALTRMTAKRPEEDLFRANQDTFYGLVFGYQNVQVDPAVRALCREFKCFDRWGLHRDVLRRVLNQMPQANRELLQRRVHNATNMMVGLFEAMVNTTDVEARIRHIGECRMILATDYANRPHPKRELRLRAIVELWRDPNYILGYKQQKPTTNVKNETAKYLKIPRQFIGMGDVSAMCEASLAEHIKKCWNGVIHVPLTGVFDFSMSVRFVSAPEAGLMDAIFNQIFVYHTSPEILEPIAFLHSDDSSLTCSVFINGTLHKATLDLDISKCDLSHGPCLFASLVQISRAADLDIGMSVHHLMSNIVMRHPTNKEDFIEFSTPCPLLYTGSTLTTMVNTYSVYLLLSLVCSRVHMAQFFNRDELLAAITEEGRAMGYILTLEGLILTPVLPDQTVLQRADTVLIEDVTFLKYYPVRVDADPFRVCAFPCLGRFFRSFGLFESLEADLNMAKNVVRTFLSCHSSDTTDMISKLVFGINHSELTLIQDLVLESGSFNWNLQTERVRLNDTSLWARYHRGKPTSDAWLAIEGFFGDLSPVMDFNPVLMGVVERDYSLVSFRNDQCVSTESPGKYEKWL